MLECIKTERLYLIPLQKEELYCWMNDIAELETRLQVTYRDEIPTGQFKNFIAVQYEKVCQDMARWIYHTFFLIVLKEGRVVIGSCDFKSPPNAQGEVEIGYGIHPAFQKNGYMPEGVAGMVNWAFRQGDIQSVTAETESGNNASERVLTKAGFTRREPFPDENGSTWWFVNK